MATRDSPIQSRPATFVCHLSEVVLLFGRNGFIVTGIPDYYSERRMKSAMILLTKQICTEGPRKKTLFDCCSKMNQGQDGTAQVPQT